MTKTKLHAPDVFELSIQDAALVVESLSVYLRHPAFQNPEQDPRSSVLRQSQKLQNLREEIGIWYGAHSEVGPAPGAVVA